MNYDDFKKIMQEAQYGDDNSFYNTLDIMRNYLDNDNMHSCISHLHALGFSFNYFILTANNITDFTFLTRFGKLSNMRTLILSRNKIIKSVNLRSELLEHLPNLKELDLS